MQITILVLICSVPAVSIAWLWTSGLAKMAELTPEELEAERSSW